MKRMIHLFICLAIIVLLSGCDILLGLYATVDFDSNGGTRVKPTYVSFGDLANEPRDPERNGYIFIGWYLGNKKWDFNKDIVQKDITLKAFWKPDNPANYDTNAAWQLLNGTWTNGIYTVTFEPYLYGYNWYKRMSWSGYGATGTVHFYGIEYNNSREVMCINEYILGGYRYYIDIVFSADSTTMELVLREGNLTFLPPGEWTKLP